MIPALLILARMTELVMQTEEDLNANVMGIGKEIHVKKIVIAVNTQSRAAITGRVTKYAIAFLDMLKNMDPAKVLRFFINNELLILISNLKNNPSQYYRKLAYWKLDGVEKSLESNPCRQSNTI
ncbi:hypothetical protein AVEN_217205-1 [Araneus ventricosus]|uniref:Uncharacterized protein n=1 Tax=Araneus ventricosus TaxID=182803 RepID=A0A4Y2TMB9_ARAVE|nr:hypothetical protein AVEN_217205-1 [Araneus ventricosus]